MKIAHQNLQVATLAGGCFWCTEAVFKRLNGVIGVKPGYAGGTKPNPTYQEVTSGNTGYAEAIQIEFDSTIISFEKLLEIFWKLHDPTTLNRQGNDVGTQYRSAIFYHDDEQKKVAEASKLSAEQSHIYKDVIVTEITAFTNFYPAEEYHQDFYDRNRDYPYCSIIIDPKIQKLYKDFSKQLKK